MTFVCWFYRLRELKWSRPKKPQTNVCMYVILYFQLFFLHDNRYRKYIYVFIKSNLFYRDLPIFSSPGLIYINVHPNLHGYALILHFGFVLFFTDSVGNFFDFWRERPC